MTMSVILVTLVVQGCSLAPIIRAFDFQPETRHHDEEQFARVEALRRASEELEDAAREGALSQTDVAWLRSELRERMEYHRNPQAAQARHHVRSRMREAERRLLVRLRNEGAISDEVLRELEQELDLDALRGNHVDANTNPRQVAAH